MSDAQDRQDEDLAKKTTQVDPSDKITDDSDLEDSVAMLEGHLSDLEAFVDDKNFVEALDTAGQLQDLTDRIHTYLSEKVDNG